MRFMMLMIPNIPSDDWTPPVDLVEKMTRYNEELTKAGVLLSADGLLPDSHGVRVTYDTGSAIAKDGPFTEAKEILGGYWIIETKTKEEAVEWAKRIPTVGTEVVEVRQIAEMEDFSEEIQRAAGF